MLNFQKEPLLLEIDRYRDPESGNWRVNGGKAEIAGGLPAKLEIERPPWCLAPVSGNWSLPQT